MKGRKLEYREWRFIQLLEFPFTKYRLSSEEVASAMADKLSAAGISHIWGSTDPDCLGCGGYHP